MFPSHTPKKGIAYIRTWPGEGRRQGKPSHPSPFSFFHPQKYAKRRRPRERTNDLQEGTRGGAPTYIEENEEVFFSLPPQKKMPGDPPHGFASRRKGPARKKCVFDIFWGGRRITMLSSFFGKREVAEMKTHVMPPNPEECRPTLSNHRKNLPSSRVVVSIKSILSFLKESLARRPSCHHP